MDSTDELVSEEPIFIPGEVGEYSCPRCKAGVEWHVKMRVVATLHTYPNCRIWRDSKAKVGAFKKAT